MQIPYDLEFVENRPVVNVGACAVAVARSRGAWRGEKPRSEQDAFDALLHWVHRVIARLENRSR